jgi:hypothetical protein
MMIENGMRISSMAVATLMLTVATAALAAQQPAERQAYRTAGLHVAAGLMANVAASALLEERDHGGGVAFRVGYHFGDRLGLYLRGAQGGLSASGSERDDYGMGYWDLGVRFHPAPPGRLNAYVEGGFTDHTVVEDRRIYSRGSAFSAGAGVDIPLARRFALDVGFVVTRGMIKETRVQSEPFESLGDAAYRMTSARLGAAGVWRRGR